MFEYFDFNLSILFVLPILSKFAY